MNWSISFAPIVCSMLNDKGKKNLLKIVHDNSKLIVD